MLRGSCGQHLCPRLVGRQKTSGRSRRKNGKERHEPSEKYRQMTWRYSSPTSDIGEVATFTRRTPALARGPSTTLLARVAKTLEIDRGVSFTDGQKSLERESRPVDFGRLAEAELQMEHIG